MHIKGDYSPTAPRLFSRSNVHFATLWMENSTKTTRRPEAYLSCLTNP